MTYTLGLDDPINEGTTCRSAVWTMIDEQTTMLTHAEHYVHKFLGFSMVRGLAVCSYMLFICFGSLDSAFEVQTWQENDNGKGNELHRPQRQQGVHE